MSVAFEGASNMALERPAGSPSLAAAAHRQRSAHWRTCTTAASTYERAGALARRADGSWLLSGISLCMVNVWRA